MPKTKKKTQTKEEQKQYPEGHFLGVGIAIGMLIFSGVGVALSTSLDNPGLIGIGPAIGVAIGVAIGQAMEDKAKKEGKVRPLTPKEKKRQKLLSWIGLGIALLAGIAVVATIILLR